MNCQHLSTSAKITPGVFSNILVAVPQVRRLRTEFKSMRGIFFSFFPFLSDETLLQ